MDLREALTTTPATREFTEDPVEDTTVHRILELARFAPNGGNRQGWAVLVVRDRASREALVRLSGTGARRYAAQKLAGEQPWNTIKASQVDAPTIAATSTPPWSVAHYRSAAVLLVLCVDLSVVASMDSELDRVGLVSGASIYPFAWSVLLAARAEGLGGVLTTMPIAEEPAVQQLLGIPPHVAVAGVIPLGHPARRVTRLRRGPVEDFTRLERWDGPRLGPGEPTC